ncbi:MAG: hypothetical protein ABMB14_29640 [Myxococcota bacterium]
MGRYDGFRWGAWAAVAVVVAAAIGGPGCTSHDSDGDIQGPHRALVGETVTITSTGWLRSKKGDTSQIELDAYDGYKVLGDLRITDLQLDGGTEQTGKEEPAAYDEGFQIRRSNVLYLKHDQGAVKYTATAEVTCIAPGEVRDRDQSQFVGLEWDYNDGDSGGVLSLDPHTFVCEGDTTFEEPPGDTGTTTTTTSTTTSTTYGGSGR